MVRCAESEQFLAVGSRDAELYRTPCLSSGTRWRTPVTSSANHLHRHDL
ncbi:hypothetical protein STRIP9103_02551 [Streptomyces ipomoeae 91-03]|uniref:Uncharacterized protein n=1 Tax=Streptomyces ipomoeae 91-03 TaxID=698759 RepID=L1KIV0_9ACTN|nr:hypothetical protein STRIP9103_02551 [Streptomyces ipomoeae 91-03]